MEKLFAGACIEDERGICPLHCPVTSALDTILKHTQDFIYEKHEKWPQFFKELSPSSGQRFFFF